MGHRRILGKTTDFITGREITDTDDERYRQKIARFLVERRGYDKADIEVKRRLVLSIDGQSMLSLVDLIVSVQGRCLIAIKYGPGSLVTRERPALACARIAEPYEIPLTVVTNGEDAEVIETRTGAVIASGLEGIPGKQAAAEQFGRMPPNVISADRRTVEERVLTAYDWLEHSLECDDDWCSPE
jgi:hypothetical protein